MPGDSRNAIAEWLVGNLGVLINLLRLSVPGDVDVGDIEVDVRDDLDAGDL